MKKYFTYLIAIMLFSGVSSAQRCGTATAAIPNNINDTATMFTPISFLLPCIDSGSYVSDTIYFYNNPFPPRRHALSFDRFDQ